MGMTPSQDKAFYELNDEYLSTDFSNLKLLANS